MNFLQKICKAALAGLLIGIAAWIYLACTDKIVGAFLFSVGLSGVIILEAHLFTGKIGYVHDFNTLRNAALILLINVSVAFLIGLVYRGCVGTSIAMTSRLDKTWYRLLADGFGCGVLIYLAVEGYKHTKSVLLVIFCVAAFILAGFEHCIADAMYFGASELTWQGLGAICLVVIGNSLGSLVIRTLQIAFLKIKEQLRLLFFYDKIDYLIFRSYTIIRKLGEYGYEHL